MSTTTATAGTTLAEARAQFRGGCGYLAACTMGLPTAGTVEAMSADLARWSAAGASAAEYTALVERTREHYARLVHAEVARVAIGSQTSAMVAVIAASAPDGAEVVCADGDFSSVVFPFLSQAHRGVTVRHVPIGELAEAVTARTWLVAFSLVQSATGVVAHADAVIAAARRHGAFTLCDTTQAVGWMPVDARSFDATVCHAYKWLCAPRGVAFLTIGERLAHTVRPVQTGWYAGEDPWASCYGPVMELASDARRFDLSPAWQAWTGAEPALRLFAELDTHELRDHVVGLADAFCERVDLPARGQAIVSWPDADGCDLARLTAAGITASGRAGRARVAFHVFNDLDDVDAAARALGR